tara:strand:- start:2140 stop:2718 length:579 start_codon:yes stop_codon:yes gene_type:complete
MANKLNNDIHIILLIGILVLLILLAVYITIDNDFDFNFDFNIDFQNLFNSDKLIYVNNSEVLNNEYDENDVNDENGVNDENLTSNILENFNITKRSFKTKKRETYQNNGRLEFYSMDGCDHCNDFKPIWNKIKNRSDIKCIAYKPYDKNYDKYINKYNISEFPHIQKILPNGTAIKYEGNRNYNSITRWYFT